MKYTAGYDRDFAAQFFRRTFNSLAVVVDGRFLPMEIDYVAQKMSETVVFSQQPRLGSPWYYGDIRQLAETTRNTADRRLLQLAEVAANQLLIFEGVVTRGGLQDLRGQRPKEKTLNRQKLAAVLYRHASNWRWHRESERFVLRRMSANVQAWVELLRLVPGNDYLELLAEQPSTVFVLCGKE